MTTDDYALRDRIDTVTNATGSGDDLLTIAVAAEAPIGEVLERVEENHAEAEYIHADETSSDRRAVLERARHLLHGYDGTPEHGLALYVGALEGEDGVADFAFDDPPEPVREDVYEWGGEFDVSPLETSVGASATYGLLVVERGGAALGRLDDGHVADRDDGDGRRVDASGHVDAAGRVEVVETIDSDVMGKTKAGGQSAQRFAHDRERQKREFFEEVAGEAERAFLDGEEPAVDGLLVGGTTVTVDEFVDGDALDHRLQNAVVGRPAAVEYASEQGLRQLVEKRRAAIDDAGREAVRDALERFRTGLREGSATGDGEGAGADGQAPEVVYGEDAVDRALEFDAADALLVSGELPTATVREYEERASHEGGEAVVVPTDTEDGARFAETFEVAAILRFAIE